MARPNFLNFRARSAGEPESVSETSGSDALPLYHHFEESGRGWFWATDADGLLTYVSARVADRVGEGSAGLLGMPLTDLFLPSTDDRPVRDRLPFIVSKRSSFDRIILRTAADIDGRWWEVSGRAVTDASDTFLGYQGYCIDVTEQLQTSESASQLALFDPLTGLPNRLNMSRFLDENMRMASRPGGACAVLLIDLDRFKQVNDSLGHPAGDALLKMVATRLTKIVGNVDKIFRLGGDEFQVILPGCGDREQLQQLSDQIIHSVSQPYVVEGSRCMIGASIGIAVAPDDGCKGEEVMRNADLALYAAKGSGRGCYRFFSASLLEVAEDRRVLEDDLRDALSRDELSLFYQPVVCTRTSSVTGVEALIRWQHPVRGAISPAVFIPIAEDANLIDALGEWIIRKACDDAVRWPGNIRVAVNVSPIQFANEALPTIIISALANSGLPASRLELELTEGVFLSESVETDTMFSTLKDIGVRLALDDFGTGYSSLGYLKTAPFDKIKIDQSFVRGATLPGSRNGAIIAAIVALAGALKMETTAEGIETLDQLDLIRDLGVSHIQGYVYSKPLPETELAERLAQGEWTLNPTGPAKQRSDRRSIFRRAGVIVGSHYHAVMLRNLSDTGALLDGITGIPVDTVIVVDLGECQMEIATVRRCLKNAIGVEFNNPLLSDENGNFSTRGKVSPYALAKIGLSSTDHLGSSRMWDPSNTASIETLTRNLGLTLSQPGAGSGFGAGDGLSNAALYQQVQQAFTAAGSPLQDLLLRAKLGDDRQLTGDEWERLKSAVETSQNTQLKYIIALVVMTGLRLHELMAAQWSDINFDTRQWRVGESTTGTAREIPLSLTIIGLLEQLPRWDDCPHLIVNPRTRKPYSSVFGSWDAARKKAGLDHLSIHELRNSIHKSW